MDYKHIYTIKFPPPDNGLCLHTISFEEERAVSKFMDDMDENSWEDYLNKGFKIVEIEIKEKTNE